MFCPNCGKEVPDYASFCVHCGTAVTRSNTTPQQPQPYQPAPPQTVYVVSNTDQYGRTPEQRLKEYSAKSKVCGILSLVFSSLIWIAVIILLVSLRYSRSAFSVLIMILTVLALFLQIPGLILSIVGLSSSLRFRRMNQGHNGNSLTGLICSIIALSLIVLTIGLYIFGPTISLLSTRGYFVY